VHRLRELGGHELHHLRPLGLDQLDVVAVHDVPARCLDALLAHAVLAGDRDVILAREHLQEPQTEEHDREQHERDPAQHGHPPRQLGRDRPDALFDSLWHG
jgi:hypothetical protein